MENKEELEILKMLEEAKEDVKNGRVSSAEGMFDEIRKKLDLFIDPDIKKIIENKKYMILNHYLNEYLFLTN